SQIRDGLHILGRVPEGEDRLNLLMALTRLDNGVVPSLRRTVAEAMGLEYEALLADRGRPMGELPAIVQRFANGGPLRTHGDVLEAVDRAARTLLEHYEPGQNGTAAIDRAVTTVLGEPHPAVARVLEFVHD